MEGEGIGACSLAHNTLKGRGACWSSGMRLGRVNKFTHSHGLAHNSHKVVKCIIGAPLVLGRATGSTDTQDSQQLGLGGSHHLPPYSILCTFPRGPTSKWLFSLGTPEWESRNRASRDSRDFGAP
jgi:hypothetical protein